MKAFHREEGSRENQDNIFYYNRPVAFLHPEKCQEYVSLPELLEKELEKMRKTVLYISSSKDILYHFPIQNRLNTLLNKSSAIISPVMLPRLSNASRNS